MIQWLLEDSTQHPDIEQGLCPAGLLNGAEHRQFQMLRQPKRRREWLLGRWTAKRLLQTLVAQRSGSAIAPTQLTILNTPSGAPVVSGVWFENVTLSISHRGGYAFCAARLRPLGCSTERCSLGADIELIEPRAHTFADSYFTAPECAALASAGDAGRDLMTTAIWSAKESALKAAHLGLLVDTRAVTCHIAPTSLPAARWIPFGVSWDDRLLGGHPKPDVQGWWRSEQNYVLTIAAKHAADGMPAPAPIASEGAFA
jgi:4'-phosphopantetheinyl transferase